MLVGGGAAGKAKGRWAKVGESGSGLVWSGAGGSWRKRVRLGERGREKRAKMKRASGQDGKKRHGLEGESLGGSSQREIGVSQAGPEDRWMDMDMDIGHGPIHSISIVGSFGVWSLVPGRETRQPANLSSQHRRSTGRRLTCRRALGLN